MIFVLIGKDEERLGPLVEAAYPDHLKIGQAQWLISTPGTPTSKQVWERVAGELRPGMPTGMVFPVTTGYYGVAAPSVWEWISAKKQVEV
jgi:hypothetical protein